MSPKILIFSILITLTFAATVKKASDLKVKKVIITAPIDYTEISYKDDQSKIT